MGVRRYTPMGDTPKSMEDLVMPKKIVPLTDIKVKATKPSTKPLKLFDGGGLFLFIAPTGGKMWRLKYRFKRKALGLGGIPRRGFKRGPQKAGRSQRTTCHGQ